MRPPFVERIDASFHHVRRRIEIGLANLQMDDALSLALQRPRFVQHLKRCFCTKPGHAAGKLQFVLRGSLHGRKNSSKTQTAHYTLAIFGLLAGPSSGLIPAPRLNALCSAPSATMRTHEWLNAFRTLRCDGHGRLLRP